MCLIIRYDVRPHHGQVAPKSDTSVTMTLLPFHYKPEQKYSDKFLLQVIIIFCDTSSQILIFVIFCYNSGMCPYQPQQGLLQARHLVQRPQRGTLLQEAKEQIRPQERLLIGYEEDYMYNSF